MDQSQHRDIPVVILCGGRGARLQEQTEFRPKPMVEIGGQPILWHIMKSYAHYGFKDFILCLGYKGDMIRSYFLNYEAMNNDVTVSLGKPNQIRFHRKASEDWTVTLVNTGETAMTGARVKRIEPYIQSDLFMLTYGDGVASLDLAKLLEYHKKQGKIGTITGIHPPSRFGHLTTDGKNVLEFSEKPTSDGYINGGFFVFDKKFFGYLSDDDNCYLERGPLERLAKKKELVIYPHNDFWQCMDTYRDLQLLNTLWASGKPPWRVWP